jgi:hypothetical protein
MNTAGLLHTRHGQAFFLIASVAGTFVLLLILMAIVRPHMMMLAMHDAARALDFIH